MCEANRHGGRGYEVGPRSSSSRPRSLRTHWTHVRRPGYGSYPVAGVRREAAAIHPSPTVSSPRRRRLFVPEGRSGRVSWFEANCLSSRMPERTRWATSI